MNSLILNCLIIGTILSGIFVIITKNSVHSVLFLITVFVLVAGYLISLGLNFIGLTYLIVYVGAVAILFLFVVMMVSLGSDSMEPTRGEREKVWNGVTTPPYSQGITGGGGASKTEYNSLTEVVDRKNLWLAAIIGTLFLTEIILASPKPIIILPVSGEPNPLFIFNQLILKPDPLIQSVLTFMQNSGLYGFDIGLFHSWSNFYFTFSEIESLAHLLYARAPIWFLLISAILLLAMIGPIELTLDSDRS